MVVKMMNDYNDEFDDMWKKITSNVFCKEKLNVFEYFFILSDTGKCTYVHFKDKKANFDQWKVVLLSMFWLL